MWDSVFVLIESDGAGSVTSAVFLTHSEQDKRGEDTNGEEEEEEEVHG